MSRNASTKHPPIVDNRGVKRKEKVRKPDSRVRRTRDQLGNALIELIQEKPINDVTVQDVLDRSGVGRSTFYLHYRDKDDLLVSQLEMFLEFMSTVLSVRKDKSNRVAPVTEMFEHIGNQNKLYRVLSDSGHLKDFFDLAEGYFARGIERRLCESGRFTKIPPRELAARASALSGSLLSLLRWWLDRGEKETPQQMDEMFHRMVWTGLQ
ncbi:TetR/AcrR family transcriptional regulator [Telmatobacter sp. DSM 110680]|uniref:TetR/AcrR family transcriptional regulator n=1 Tax=Telmatobacter sp. DSM 110680 TaxID=3036704 RepID=A0AAU7DLT3_9BACT